MGGGMGGMAMGGMGGFFGGPGDGPAAAQPDSGFDSLVDLIAETQGVPCAGHVGHGGWSHGGIRNGARCGWSPRRRMASRAMTCAAARGRRRPSRPSIGCWMKPAIGNPSVVTGPDGKATLAIKLPERTTAWTLMGKGITTATLAGEASTDLVAKKDLYWAVEAAVRLHRRRRGGNRGERPQRRHRYRHHRGHAGHADRGGGRSKSSENWK